MTLERLFARVIKKSQSPERTILIKTGSCKDWLCFELDEEDKKWARVWKALNEPEIEVFGIRENKENYALAILAPRGIGLKRILPHSFPKHYLEPALRGKHIPGYQNLVVISSGEQRGQDPRIDWKRLAKD